ncbi:DUF4190 domain-containing protein [Nocardia niigatensis]
MWGPAQPALYSPQQPPPARGGQNGLAVAAFITGLLGLVFLALPFGLIALAQIRARGQQGRGLAIAGLVISGAWAAAAAAVFVTAVSHSHTPADLGASDSADSSYISSAPTTTAASALTPGYTVLRNLRSGDCVNAVNAGTAISGAIVTSCNTAHDGQVFSTFALPAWQNADGQRDYVETRCGQIFDAFHRPDLNWIWYAPSDEEGWQRDPSVQCVLVDPTKAKITGMVR